MIVGPPKKQFLKIGNLKPVALILYDMNYRYKYNINV